MTFAVLIVVAGMLSLSCWIQFIAAVLWLVEGRHLGDRSPFIKGTRNMGVRFAAKLRLAGAWIMVVCVAMYLLEGV